MALQIIPKSRQAKGQFNGGAILENKPIGFPQEGGATSAYSNLFYWAHAWSDKGSVIGEHPHRGFEIMSFVLKGEIEHYDSQLRDWKKLGTGDAQIIRSGNGISHAEHLLAGSHIFQIWVDPNLQTALSKPATYDDYEYSQIPLIQEASLSIRQYAGENGPMTMDAEGLNIRTVDIPVGAHQLKLDVGLVHSFYLIEGNLNADSQEMKVDDFAIIKEQETVAFEAKESSKIFMISSPAKVSYPTYAEIQRA